MWGYIRSCLFRVVVGFDFYHNSERVLDVEAMVKWMVAAEGLVVRRRSAVVTRCDPNSKLYRN